MSGRENVGLTAMLAAVLLAAFAALVAAVLVFTEAVLVQPAWLALGLAAPLLILLDVVARRWRNRSAASIGEAAAVARLVQGRARGVRALRSLVAACAVVLLAVCCSRPQWGYVEEQVERRGIDVFVCLDTSKSMLADDVKPDRLTRAKIEVSSFIDRLGGDRVGIIAFAGEARVLCPLTQDHAAAKLFLDVIEPDMLDRPGTAIGEALDVARKAFAKDSERHAVVLLVTDGEDHGGRAVAAAKDLADAGVIVHSVGIGSPGGSPLPVVTESAAGRQVGYLKDESGNVVMSRLDADTLRKIAAATGGTFYQATSSEMELTAIAGTIAQMEQREFGTRTARLRPERYAWFLAVAFALLAVEAFLPDGAPLRFRQSFARLRRAAAVKADSGAVPRAGSGRAA